jgi:hypothetical protein
MKNITIGQAINENKGFFKVNEVVKSFKNYRYLENDKYIKTYFDILKYEINEIKFKKILKNEEITKFDTTIGYISKYLSEEDRKIYDLMKESKTKRIGYKIEQVSDKILISFMNVENLETGLFRVSFSEYVLKEILGEREKSYSSNPYETNYYKYLRNKYCLEKEVYIYSKIIEKEDDNYNEFREMLTLIEGDFETIKKVIAKSGYKKVTMDNLGEMLEEVTNFVKDKTNFEDYQLIPTEFKNIDDLF